MKFLSTLVATKAVLAFLCVTVTIEEASCATNITTHPLQPSSAAASSTVEAELLSAIQEEAITKQKATDVHSNSNSTTKRTCACDDTEETFICASNGITYKNTCRFECAKARVTRLRQVKQGRCSQAAGAQSYWQSKSG